MKLYSLKIDELGEFQNPFIQKNDKLAIYNSDKFFQQKKEELAFSTYSLWCLGDFDEETGEIHNDITLLKSYTLSDFASNKTKNPQSGGIMVDPLVLAKVGEKDGN